jgi:prevent-host-death family protein
MKTMTITHFKTYALKVVDQVSKSQESVVITKRGSPLAEVIPFRTTKKKTVLGKLASTVIFEKDIVSPLGDEVWEPEE